MQCDKFKCRGGFRGGGEIYHTASFEIEKKTFAAVFVSTSMKFIPLFSL
jgi:hypothetical protein